jgi:hypothetical protein
LYKTGKQPIKIAMGEALCLTRAGAFRLRDILAALQVLRLSMSALGQKQTFERLDTMSALPPKADIAQRDDDVRFVP